MEMLNMVFKFIKWHEMYDDFYNILAEEHMHRIYYIVFALSEIHEQCKLNIIYKHISSMHQQLYTKSKHLARCIDWRSAL